jgi:hypothetical protein
VQRLKFLTSVRDEQAGLGPVEYTALVSENALREQIGGRSVALAQLKHLLTINSLPTVTLQVVPSGGDWHPGLSGPFILYNFADAQPIVHIEPYSSTVFLYDDADTLKYKSAATALRRLALDPDASGEAVRKAIAEMERA